MQLIPTKWNQFPRPSLVAHHQTEISNNSNGKLHLSGFVQHMALGLHTFFILGKCAGAKWSCVSAHICIRFSTSKKQNFIHREVFGAFLIPNSMCSCLLLLANEFLWRFNRFISDANSIGMAFFFSVLLHTRKAKHTFAMMNGNRGDH